MSAACAMIPRRPPGQGSRGAPQDGSRGQGSSHRRTGGQMTRKVVLIGTRKGMWIGTSDQAREEWQFTGPHFNMEEVYSCMVDKRHAPPRLMAGASSSWLGPQVRWSDDLGASWQETPGGGIKFPEGAGATVARVWQLVPGVEEGTVWA